MPRNCPDCGVTPGRRHGRRCDGLSRRGLPPMQTWTGEWPGSQYGASADWAGLPPTSKVRLPARIQKLRKRRKS